MIWVDRKLEHNTYQTFKFQDLIGNTPLHTAFHNSRTEIAQYLIASGANENQKNKSGLTPFDLGK